MGENRAVLGRDAVVGRDRELAQLDALVTDVRRGGLVVVEGEPGIGKSRLLAEVGATASAAGSRVVRGVADEVDPRPLGLWHGPARALGLPRLAGDTSVAPDEQRWEALELLAGGLAGPAPTVLLLDDLHWADDASLWVLDRLLADLADDPVVVVAGSRPGDAVRSARWAGIRRRGRVLALDGLDGPAVAALVAQADGDGRVDVDALLARTAGNPLLLLELLAHADDGRLPLAVTDVLRATVEQAGADQARVLTALALAGEPTPVAVLAVALGADAEVVAGHLEAAEARAVLRTEDGRLWFRHALLAEAAAGRPDPAGRRELHAALAAAWAGAGDDLPARTAAARHLLRAVPTVAATEAVDTARTVADALRAEGDAASATALLAAVGAVLRAELPGDVERRARAEVARAEALLALEAADEATEVADAARTLAEGTDDAVLRAAAEVAATTHHNPFVPDEVAVTRLAAADAALSAVGDDAPAALRVRLLGRRAALVATFPDRAEEAAALAERAIARAREVDDPELVVRALTERHLAPLTAADLAAQDAAAEEIAALARRAGRADLALIGHEWSLAAHVRRGELADALAAMADLEALSSLMPSPRWRFAAAFRRSQLMALLGDRDGALDLIAASAHIADGALPEGEVVGLRIGGVALVEMTYGQRPGQVEDLHRRAVEEIGALPAAFLQVRFGLTDVHLGEDAAARTRLAPWLRRPDAVLRTPEGLGTVALMAEAVALLGWSEHAAALRTTLDPFRGLLPIVTAVGCVPSVDDLLAGLALLDGDAAGAADHAGAALGLARAMGAPPLEARALALLAEARSRTGDATAATSARDTAERIADGIGQRLRPAPDPPPAPAAPVAPAPAAPAEVTGVTGVTGEAGPARASLRRDRGTWHVTSPHGTGTVPDSRGMGQLVRLLAAPGTEVAAVDLADAGGAAQVPLASDLGPALDARAKREYRARITELRAELDEAEDHHDLGRAEKHRAELDALLAELSRAVGLGGRDRPQGSGAERARINVARSLRRAVVGVEGAVPDLGAHLRVSLRTGHRCAYAPEPAAALTWDIRVDR